MCGFFFLRQVFTTGNDLYFAGRTAISTDCFSINLKECCTMFDLCFVCLFVLLRVKKASNTGFDLLLLLLRVLNAPPTKVSLWKK